MRPAILAGSMMIPVERIKLATVQKQLTYTYRPMGAEESVKVLGYKLDGDFLHVPRQYGLSLCNQLQIPFEDHTSQGFAVEFPNAPTPKDYQVKTLGEIREGFDSYYDILFRAHTGWGKTVGALLTAVDLGVTTLIIVDQDNLKDQWIERLKDPNLFGLSDEQVGVIQGPRSDFRGKLVVVAMVQTLVQRGFTEEFYRYFGFVVGDEVHTLGAPTFSQALFMFPAAWRLFVSATPRRRDGLQRALDHHCGPIRVAADKEHAESSVYILRNQRVYSWYANISPKTGRIVSEITEDAQRNLLIAETAIWLVESGRDTLILSDRVAHLKELKYLMVYLGVPEEDIGLYTGYDPVWKFTKDPNPSHLPRGLHRWVGEDGKTKFAPYSAVSMQLKEPKVPKAKLQQIEKDCKIILATYGKFSKGKDTPRLAAGIDASPRATSEQSQGRILREKEGKMKPIWATIVDENSYRALHWFSGRISDYLLSNSRLFEWDGQEGITECNVQRLRAEVSDRHAELQNMEIHQQKDGSHRLVAKGTAMRNAAEEMKARLKRVSQKETTSPSAASSGRSRVMRGRS